MRTRTGQRTTRRRRAVIGAAAAAAVALPLAACGATPSGEAYVVETGTDTGTPADATAAGALVRASDATSAVESGRMRVSYRIQGSAMDESIDAAFTAEGSFADFGRRAELTIDMGSFMGAIAEPGQELPGRFVMHEIIDGDDLYMRVDSDVAVPGIGSGWTHVDVSDLAGQGTGAGGFGSFGSGPNGFVEAMKGAGASVAETGTDVIDGAPVTVYEGTIDPEAAMAAADPEDAEELERALDQLGGTFEMPFTAWIDDDGLLRRMELRVDMGLDDGELGMQMSLVMTLELYDFGAPITITPPPPDQVTEGGTLDQFGGLSGDLGTA